MSVSSRTVFIFTLIVGAFFIPSASFSQEIHPVNHQAPRIDTDFPLPDKLSLCNEPMPLENQWAWEMLDREMTISAWNKDQVFMWLKRAGRYFPYIEEALTRENMPQDIKYLAIAESGLLPRIRSSMGAMGVWQFMEETAVRHGLRSDDRMDERRDMEASTAAALKYLRNLKDMFGSWTLAMAAYNCGEQRVKKAIKEQGQADYYNLKLPDETERYIYRIASVKLIMENPEAYGYRVPEEKIYKPLQMDTATVTIKKTLHITDFAEALGTTYKLIRDMNPKITGSYLPSGSYALNVPSGKGALVPAVIKSLSGKSSSRAAVSSSSRTHVVKSGDTLGKISIQTGIPIAKLKKLNNLKGETIQVGQTLSLE